MGAPLDVELGVGVVPVVALPVGNTGVDESVWTTSPVALVHAMEESIEAVLLSVMSAHCERRTG